MYLLILHITLLLAQLFFILALAAAAADDEWDGDEEDQAWDEDEAEGLAGEEWHRWLDYWMFGEWVVWKFVI